MPSKLSKPTKTQKTQDTARGPVYWDGDQQLVLEKHGQRYSFRCLPGDESQLLNQLAQLVDDPESGLDWFDAAVLSHHMGERLRQRISSISPQRAKAS